MTNNRVSPILPRAHGSPWLALAIGNSRLHWAYWVGEQLSAAWDTSHLTAAQVSGLIAQDFNFATCLPDADQAAVGVSPTSMASPVELWIASVVPRQSDLWLSYPGVHLIQLAQIPLQGLYPTLGIDRALATYGAVTTLGAPVLVIDAGTALTVTGIDASQHLVGGAILPGIRLQLQSLNQKTAALPQVNLEQTQTIPRWATDTEAAIASGILHTLVAGIQSFVSHWWQQFPGSIVLWTGGDAELLQAYLRQENGAMAEHMQWDPHLILRGMQAIRRQQLAQRSS